MQRGGERCRGSTRRRSVWAVLSIGIAALGACRSQRQGAPAPQARSDIEYAGCAVVRAGPRCTLPADAELRIWVPSNESLRIESTPTHAELAVRSEPESRGTLYFVRVPQTARAIHVARPSGERVFGLQIDATQEAALPADFEALRARGQYAAARRALENVRSQLSAEAAARAEALLARLAYTQGDVPAALAGRQTSLEQAYRDQRLSDIAEDATAVSFMLSVNLRQYAQARSVLERAAAATQADPGASALLRHYFGVLALETGDLRAALRAFEDATARLSRLRMRKHELIARQQHAETLANLGRHADAVREQQQVVQQFASGAPCMLVDRQEAVTWFALLAEPSAGSELAREASASVVRSEQLLAGCSSDWTRRNHEINAGLLALQLGELEQARLRLATLGALPHDASDVLSRTWENELRGRLALAERQPTLAQESFRNALELARQNRLRDSEQRAELGLARALLQLGQRQAARERYVSAEAVLDDQLQFVPFGEGQASFQHAREAGTRELVELLVQLEDLEGALNVARHARRRMLSALPRATRLAQLAKEQRSEWEAAHSQYHAQRALCERADASAWSLPKDALAEHARESQECRRAARVALDRTQSWLGTQPDEAGFTPTGQEVMLAYFPRDEGIRAFVKTATGTRSLALPRIESGASTASLSATLLEPFAAELTAASRVHVLTHAGLAALDVHALQVAGRVLLERAPVDYVLDLSGSSANLLTQPTTAALIANPTGDLPGAELEVRAVLRQLQARSTLSTDIWSGAQATRAQVSAAISGYELFHFAGHARYHGLEGVDSVLVVADGEISIGDVLSARRSPALVVLAACDAAYGSSPGFSSGLSLAHAFLAAGSRQVVGAARPVRDQHATRFFAEFYHKLLGDLHLDGAQALRAAALELRATDASSDWATYRVLIP